MRIFWEGLKGQVPHPRLKLRTLIDILANIPQLVFIDAVDRMDEEYAAHF